MPIFLGYHADDQPLHLSPELFLRHAVCLGASGSGKTVACKIICEEFLLQRIPVLALDPQGDIASLILPAEAQELLQRGEDPARLTRFQQETEIIIWTPGSRAGIPLSLDPLRIRQLPVRKEIQIRILSATASHLAALLGYPPDSQDARYITAYLDLILQYLVEINSEIDGLDAFSAFLRKLPLALLQQVEKIISPKKREEVSRKIEILGIGARRLLFHLGAPLDINRLIGRDPQKPNDKTRLSVLYLNTLHTQEEKEFFVSQLAQALYQWMLEHPSSTPQALFYMDEIAPYLPPVRKPASKEILRLLLKQARKYGICCLLASQNPGDLDYTALAQCSTWVLGRMLVQQDIRKIEPIIRSLQPEQLEQILQSLPSLDPGRFLLISPDAFREAMPLRLRWLLTRHETLDEDRVEEASTPLRDAFADLFHEKTTALTALPAGAARHASLQRKAEVIPAEESENTDDLDENESDDNDELADPSREHKAREIFAAFLEKQPGAYTLREILDATQIEEMTLRKLLKKLQKQQLIVASRVGRSNYYALHSHRFSPKIGLIRPILTVPLQVTEKRAHKSARHACSSRLFGLLSSENVEAKGLHYLFFWRFRIHYTRKIGLLKEREEERKIHLYYHAHSTQMLSVRDGRLRFLAESEQEETEAGDITELSALTPTIPATLHLTPHQIQEMKPAAHLALLCEQRFGGEILATEMIAFPYWSFILCRKEESKRPFFVDGFFGHPFSAPLALKEIVHANRTDHDR
jgi:DNA helicase HerA-like ATPase